MEMIQEFVKHIGKSLAVAKENLIKQALIDKGFNAFVTDNYTAFRDNDARNQTLVFQKKDGWEYVFIYDNLTNESVYIIGFQDFETPFNEFGGVTVNLKFDVDNHRNARYVGPPEIKILGNTEIEPEKMTVSDFERLEENCLHGFDGSKFCDNVNKCKMCITQILISN